MQVRKLFRRELLSAPDRGVDMIINTSLSATTSDYKHLQKLVGLVVASWPEHSVYLEKSFAVRPTAVMKTSDQVAEIILKLIDGNESETVSDYTWLCKAVNDEEIFFAREDRYRYSTFAETNANVYQDTVLMRRYMHGLLLSHVLWVMHASSLTFFLQRLSARCAPGGEVLEVGSGHGLLIFLALQKLGFAGAEAWDLSQVSLDQTRHALSLLDVADKARFSLQDMHEISAGVKTYDLVILSHILEHLENPVGALASMRSTIKKNGYLFVNVPLNAPMPDHIVLLRNPNEACAMLEAAGFRVVEIASHTTQLMPLTRAIKQKYAVTCSILAQVS